MRTFTKTTEGLPVVTQKNLTVFETEAVPEWTGARRTCEWFIEGVRQENPEIVVLVENIISQYSVDDDTAMVIRIGALSMYAIVRSEAHYQSTRLITLPRHVQLLPSVEHSVAEYVLNMTTHPEGIDKLSRAMSEQPNLQKLAASQQRFQDSQRYQAYDQRAMHAVYEALRRQAAKDNVRRLWLWDIDGTIVNINPIHLAAYKLDYEHVLGTRPSDQHIVATFGMTEEEMHKDILPKYGKIWTPEINARLVAAHTPNFMGILRDAQTQIDALDGVIPLLELQHDNYDARAVVTGNLAEPADFILTNAGVRDAFPFVSCDDGKSTRVQIVQRAIAAAKDYYHPNLDVIVIGDTTKDITAARTVGARIVAVATGSDSIEKLAAANPDVLVPDLRDYEAVYRAAVRGH